MKPLPLRSLFALPLVLGLCACAIGPEHQPPRLDSMPASFKHGAGWLPATPGGGTERGDAAWWRPFADARLEGLLLELATANPGLEQARARLRQAEAALKGQQAEFFPQVQGNVAVNRSSSAGQVSKSHDLGLALSWLPDLWGRVRRQTEAGRAELEAAEAETAALRLSLQTSLAENYVTLRILDRQRTLLQETITAYERSLTLTRNQYEAGMAARVDVVQAQSQLENVRAQLLELVDQRARAENAIAVLAGRPPAALDIAADASLPELPAAPAAVPAALLTRRPDLTAAERRVAAANARIGVAMSAWLPDLTLNLSGGYRAGQASGWLDAPNKVWAVGPALALTLFDGGARSAQVDQAEAAQEEAAAAWKAAVLAALQETEDALARLRALEDLSRQQEKVVALAEENERLVTNRYREGLVSFLEVAVAQNATLAARRAALDVRRDRLQASMRLVTALGGGWPGLGGAGESGASGAEAAADREKS